MQTCSLLFGVVHSATMFCLPMPEEDGWKIGDFISLGSAIITAVGVLAAVRIASSQNRHLADEARKKERSEIRSFLRAIRTEVKVTWDNYDRIRPKWINFAREDFIAMTYAFSDKSFPIYDNAGAQVGLVPEPELQQSIVATYGLAKSLIIAFQLNNAMLSELSALEAQPYVGGTHMPQPRSDRIEHLRFDLRSQTASIREVDALLQKAVDDLLDQIDTYFKAHTEKD
jgi:hypothetical protein